MPAVCLTPHNILDLKDWLKSELPTSKTAHRLEALASGLGFRTWASLSSHMKSADTTPAIIVGLSMADLERRLAMLEHRQPSSPLPVNFDFQRKLSDPVWLPFDNKVSGSNLVYGLAKSQGLPMILFHYRRKFADLEWDYITVDSQHDKAFDSGSLPFRRCQEVLRNHPGNGRAMIECNSHVGFVKNLTINAAAEMADMLAIYFSDRNGLGALTTQLRENSHAKTRRWRLTTWGQLSHIGLCLTTAAQGGSCFAA